MSQRIAIGALLLVACSPLPEVEPGLDGGEALEALVALGAGEYELTWTCQGACDIDSPPFTTFTHVSLVGGRLAYRTDGAANTTMDDTRRSGACLASDGLQIDSAPPTEPYEWCPGVGAAEASLAWTSAYGTQTRRVWRGQARPPL